MYATPGFRHVCNTLLSEGYIFGTVPTVGTEDKNEGKNHLIYLVQLTGQPVDTYFSMTSSNKTQIKVNFKDVVPE